MIQFGDKRYFSIRFSKRDRYLIVDEEGNVPDPEECKPVIQIAAGLESALQEWAEWKEKIPVRFRINHKRFTRLKALLDKMKLEVEMSERVAYFFEHFINPVQEILNKQEKMLEHFEDAAKLVEKLLTEQVADRDRQIMNVLEQEICLFAM